MLQVSEVGAGEMRLPKDLFGIPELDDMTVTIAASTSIAHTD